ncbi:MAG: iron chelate uptake ABC transporter family permease subunit, partial [Candidatus Bathyarchaeota archaeon]
MKDEGIEARYFRRFRRWKITVVFLSVILVFVALFSITQGPVQISFMTVLKIMLKNVPFLSELIEKSWLPVEEIIILQIRLPRVLAAMLVGSALAVAGTIFQGLFRNPMADPYLIGVSAGAALGASLAIGLGVGISLFGMLNAIPIMAFIGALITVFAVYNIAKIGSRVSPLTLLLGGITISTLLTAILSVIMINMGERLNALIFWLLGGFSLSNWSQVNAALPFIIVGIIVICIFARDFNVLQLGEDQAQQLGVNVEKLKRIILIFASLITAAAVSISGIIGFVGLVIPHMTRMLVGVDHRILSPPSALAGAIILTLCD